MYTEKHMSNCIWLCKEIKYVVLAVGQAWRENAGLHHPR